MKNGKAGWVEVNLEGLRKILERRGKEVVGYELFQNALAFAGKPEAHPTFGQGSLVDRCRSIVISPIDPIVGVNACVPPQLEMEKAFVR